jgi:hypothetical protein
MFRNFGPGTRCVMAPLRCLHSHMKSNTHTLNLLWTCRCCQRHSCPTDAVVAFGAMAPPAYEVAADGATSSVVQPQTKVLHRHFTESCDLKHYHNWHCCGDRLVHITACPLQMDEQSSADSHRVRTPSLRDHHLHCIDRMICRCSRPTCTLLRTELECTSTIF